MHMHTTTSSTVDRLRVATATVRDHLRAILDDVTRRSQARRDRKSTPRVIAADEATPRDLAREATSVSVNDEQWARIQEIESSASRSAVAH